MTAPHHLLAPARARAKSPAMRKFLSSLPAVFCAAASLALIPSPAQARDALGMFGNWGAFTDLEVPRCYAIAQANKKTRSGQSQNTNGAFVSISTWPSQEVSGQFYIRMSRTMQKNASIRLNVGDKSFSLWANGRDGWATSSSQDLAIRAAFRGGSSMSISASDSRGRRFTDRYSLEGVATAMDAASVACSQQ